MPIYVPPGVSGEPKESEYNSPPIATSQPFALHAYCTASIVLCGTEDSTKIALIL